MTEKVKWVDPTPGDLADGRPMGPGDVATNVSLTNPHNKELHDQGRIVIVGSTQPGDVPPDELAESEHPEAAEEPKAESKPAPAKRGS